MHELQRGAIPNELGVINMHQLQRGHICGHHRCFDLDLVHRLLLGDLRAIEWVIELCKLCGWHLLGARSNGLFPVCRRDICRNFGCSFLHKLQLWFILFGYWGHITEHLCRLLKRFLQSFIWQRFVIGM